MAKASSSIDLRPAQDASKTATNFITVNENNGIEVHATNDEKNYVKIDADSVDVYMSKDENSISVAEFGVDGARIGQLSDAHTLISSDGFSAYNSNVIPFFNVDYDGGAIEVDNFVPFFQSQNVPVTKLFTNDTTVTLASITKSIPSEAPNNTMIKGEVVVMFNYITSALNTLYISKVAKSVNGLFCKTYNKGEYDGDTIVRLWLTTSHDGISFKKGTAYSVSKTVTLSTRKISNDSHVQDTQFILDINYDPSSDNITYTVKVKTSTSVSTNDSLRLKGNILFAPAFWYNAPISTDAPAFTFGYRAIEDEKKYGGFSSVFGENLIANAEHQFAIGKYNNNKTNTVLEIGNGTTDVTRSNALEVTWDGKLNVYGNTGTEVGFHAYNKTTSGEVFFGYGTGGTAHGVFSKEQNKWMLHYNNGTPYIFGVDARYLISYQTVTINIGTLAKFKATGNYKQSSVTITPSSGYEVVGTCGYNLDGDNCSYVTIFELYTSGNTLYYGVRNMHDTASATSIVLKVPVILRRIIS